MVSINTQPNCTCGKCSCNISKQITESRDRDRLYDFLMGLDDIYEHLKNQILATRPIPALTSAYHLISESELHRSISSIRKPNMDGAAFYTQTKKEISHIRRPKEGRSCSHCGKTNHSYDMCFERIGYPSHWNIKTMENKVGGGTHAHHHDSRNIRDMGGREKHLQGNNNYRRHPPSVAHVDSKNKIDVGVSDEQLQKIAQILQTQLLDKSRASTSESQINMTGLTLEEADWGGQMS
ncbi:unnamed protein product [Cuscuta epithymum]|nr:unnamed protein product [Cuscuta epithymum]